MDWDEIKKRKESIFPILDADFFQETKGMKEKVAEIKAMFFKKHETLPSRISTDYEIVYAFLDLIKMLNENRGWS